MEELQQELKSAQFKIKELENNLENAQKGLYEAWNDGYHAGLNLKPYVNPYQGDDAQA